MLANFELYQIMQPLCIIMVQVLGCHVQRSLSCHDSNLVDLSAIMVQLTKQHYLVSLLQEVCIYDLAHNELELMGLSVGNCTLPGSVIECQALSWSRSWSQLILHSIKACNLSVP